MTLVQRTRVTSQEQDAAITLTCFMTVPIKIERKKSKKGICKKNKISLPVSKIVQYMTLPQPLAAKIMGVSISTLKRRYYECSFGRWPINSANGEFGEEFERAHELPNEEKLRLRNIVNTTDADPMILDTLTAKVLKCAFTQIKSEN
jgi:hypothetical protein